MQHPDEGTIHSWLDGALSADEAARVEAHVKECSQCAAAVAEARGFIAGASRILTALDNAPRGVIPAVAPKKRIDPWVLRVAATVLVVAAGTLVVVRNQGGNTQTQPASDTAVMQDNEASSAERASAVMEPAPMVANEAVPRVNGATAPKAPVRNAPTVGLGEKTGARDQESGITAPTKGGLERRSVLQAPQSVVASEYAQVAAPGDSAAASGRVTGGRVALNARQSESLKVVGTPRRIGAKVTLYEVGQGDTVTLTEALPIFLDNVVVTGAGTTRAMPQGASKSARSPEAQSGVRPDAPAIAKTSDSSRTAGAPPPAAPIVARELSAKQAEMGNTLHAITWTDSVTKHTLTLTGRMPEARLQEIRIRIERERAAAAAKKSP